MTTPRRPKLWVFAGPNGAGKTTLFNDMLRGDVPYINADEIARELTPASGTVDAIRAGRIAVQNRNALIAEGQSLSIETTLSGNSAVAFMRRAQQSNYDITLAFVGIDTPELSRARIDTRVEEGGHDVPQDAVIRRFPDAMAKLALAMDLANSALIFDNSGLERCLLLDVENGQVRFIEQNLPGWFEAHVPGKWR